MAVPVTKQVEFLPYILLWIRGEMPFTLGNQGNLLQLLAKG